MRVVQQFAAIAAGALILGAAACADRGTGYSADRNDGSGAASATAGNENRTAMTVTGCFQDMSGTNNFVLSDVTDAPGASPSEKRSYRIEQSGDFEQYVGKKVSVKGWVDADSQPQGMTGGQAKANDADFNDLPELHVDSVSATGEVCGSGAK
jgi:hypothetical protein